MTAPQDWDEDDGQEPEDDWDDDPGAYVPDEADYEERQAQEEHAEHCETVHGGGDCDCPREPLLPEQADGYVFSDEPPF